ncbi:hypothetical protein [Jatrophihabitans endophyticus]|uniref:hypothetical protein n=1 Tax=Jatrophihabitans endophyticus TaxID=1206085 RepID=UPI0019FBC173|nr:hypothetical protein [Jatrophihabitans endophyticus]MBE7189375.1 hypothetical protein [Jatrophihabitans endophyticus]
MSHVAGASGSAWDSESWRGRAADRLGHHASSMLLVSIVAVVAIGLRPLPGLFLFTVPLALFAVVLLSWALMRQHDRRLCEACVAAMPLNAAEQSVRYKRRFWLAHTGSEPRFLIPYLAVLIGSNFATSTVGRIGWAVIQLSMIYLILSTTTHRRFQPWCPWCSDGGGGQEVPETPPVVPHDDRTPV